VNNFSLNPRLTDPGGATSSRDKARFPFVSVATLVLDAPSQM